MRNSPLMVKITWPIIELVGYIMTLFMSNPLLRTPAKTGADFLRVCFDRKAFGEFPKARYVDGSELYRTPKVADDEKQQKRLWEDSLKLANVKGGETVLENWE